MRKHLGNNKAVYKYMILFLFPFLTYIIIMIFLLAIITTLAESLSSPYVHYFAYLPEGYSSLISIFVLGDLSTRPCGLYLLAKR